MSHITNPGTSGGGGGSGTVTSVAGGTGTTNTPEPITTSGVVDLDLFSLTTETSLASGDWLGFVDVSVGTAPSAQRKVTLGDLSTFLATTLPFVDGTGVAGQVAYWADPNTLAGDTALVYDPATDVLNAGGKIVVGSLATPTNAVAGLELNSTTTMLLLSRLTTAQASLLTPAAGSLYYNSTLGQFKIFEFDGALFSRTPLVLEGRVGTANNPVLSLTSGGRLTGGVLGDLELRGDTTSSLLGQIVAMSRLKVDTDLATTGTDSTHHHLELGPGIYNIIDNVTLRGLNYQPTVAFLGNVSQVQLFRSAPMYQTNDAATHVIASYITLQGNPTFTPLGTTTYQITNLRGSQSNPVLTNDGVANTVSTSYGFTAASTVGATWTVTDQWGLQINVPSGAGTITNFGGIAIDDLATFAGTLTNTPFSLRSTGTGVVMRHAGAVRIGDTTVPTQKLEVLGNILITNSGSSGELRILEPGGANYTGFKAGAMTADLIYTMPTAFPTVSGQVLSGTTAGVLSWVAAASGTGTVTSVAGGVGITNSPEPITTTGTVDLDINSLATETVLASGDLFAFVDISVGTSPSSQRKVSLSDIGVGLNTLTDPFAKYLLLAGRTSTNNDYVLTTTASGTGTGAGGTDAAANYRIRSSTSGSAHTGTIDLDDLVRIRPTAATVTTSPYNAIDIWTSAFTFDVATGTLRVVNIAPTITVDADVSVFNGIRFAQTWQVATGESHGLGVHNMLTLTPTFTPAASQTISSLTLRGLILNDTYTNQGTLNVANERWAAVSTGTVNSNWTITDYGLGRMSDPGGSGTITRLGGLRVDDLTKGTSNYSLWSLGASVYLAHGGPAIVGVSQSSLTAPNANLMLDLGGALALRRIADVTCVNGNNTGLAVGNSSFIRIIGPTAAFTIHGIAGGVDGKLLLIYNTVAFNMTIADESATEGTAANRIKTMSGANQSTTAAGFAMLIYDSSQSRWICLTIQP